jgi:hypothetical protein
MQASVQTAPPGFAWRWLVFGVLANIGILFVPAYNWEGRPISTWLALVLFPYGMLWSDFGAAWFYDHWVVVPWLYRLTVVLHLDPRGWLLRYLFWFGPFVAYGMVLALVARQRWWRLCCYCLLVMHTIAAVMAAMMYYGFFRR